jgi:P2 family phage contractile tail tube protein
MSFKPGLIAETVVKKEGTDELIGLAKASLPDVERITEEMKGLGQATYEEVLPQIGAAMTTTVTFLELSDNINKIGSLDTALIINSAIAGTDSATHKAMYQALSATIKGKIKKFPGGENGIGSKNDRDLEIATTYYKLVINNKVIHEIDTLNKIIICNGVDLMAAQNKALQ